MMSKWKGRSEIKKQKATKQDVLILQEAVNGTAARVNQIAAIINELKAFCDRTQHAIEDLNKIRKAVNGIDAAVAAMGELCDEKGIFSQVEVQNRVEKLFDAQHGLKYRAMDGTFSERDMLVLSYKYEDANEPGKLIAGNYDSPVLYKVGSNGIPELDDRLNQFKELGDEIVFEHRFADDFKGKEIAGKTANIFVKLHALKTMIEDKSVRVPEQATEPVQASL